MSQMRTEPMAVDVEGERDEVDIEDLFAEEFYVELVNRSGAAAIEPFEVHGEGRIVRRNETATGLGLDRYLPARSFSSSGRTPWTAWMRERSSGSRPRSERSTICSDSDKSRGTEGTVGHHGSARLGFEARGSCPDCGGRWQLRRTTVEAAWTGRPAPRANSRARPSVAGSARTSAAPWRWTSGGRAEQVSKHQTYCC